MTEERRLDVAKGTLATVSVPKGTLAACNPGPNVAKGTLATISVAKGTLATSDGV
jgi:hypothetical protein